MAGVPFGSSTGLDALTQGVDPVTQGYAYYGKRSADAEPEADAQYIASPYAGFGAYNGLYGLGAYSYSAPALNYGLAYNGLYNGLYSRGYAAAGAPFTGCRNYVGAPVPC